MTLYLQNNLITILILLLCIIFLLIGIIFFILIKFMLSSKNDRLTKKNIRQHNIPTPSVVVEKFYCCHHQDIPSTGSCLICEEVFCEECLVDHESMHFCKEHFRIYANHHWVQITDTKTTPDTPEDGLYIYNFKRDLWSQKNIPSFVMTHYKINIENDYIESFIQLSVREEEAEKLSKNLELFKKVTD